MRLGDNPLTLSLYKKCPYRKYLGYLQEFINVFSPGSMSHCIYVLPSVYTVLLKGIKSYWLGLRYVRIVLQPLKPKFKADLLQVFTILISILFYFSFIILIDIYVIPGLCFLLINEYQYFWWFTSNTPFLSSNVINGLELFNENRLLNWSLTQKEIFKTRALFCIDKENRQSYCSPVTSDPNEACVIWLFVLQIKR